MNNFGLGIILNFVDNASGGINLAINSFHNLSHATNQASQDVEGAAKGFLELQVAGMALTAVGDMAYNMGVTVTSAFEDVMTSTIELGSTFEQTQITLATLFDSAEIAEEKIDWIFDYAKTTPFDLESVRSSFIAFKAMGFDASEVVGNTMGTMNQELISYIGDLKAFRPDLPMGWIMRGIRNAMGGSIRSLDMILDIKSESLLGRKFEDIERDLPDLVEALGVSGLMGSLEGTWQQRIMNMGIMWDQFKYEIADAGFFKKVKGMLDSVYETIMDLDNEDMARMGKTVADAFNQLVAPIGFLIEKAVGLINVFNELSKTNPELMTGIIKFVGILGGGLLGIGAVFKILGPAITTLSMFGLFLTQLKGMGGASVSSGVSKLFTRFSNLGIVIAGIAGAFYIAKKAFDSNFMGIGDFVRDHIFPIFKKLSVIVEGVFGELSGDSFVYAQENGLLPIINDISDFLNGITEVIDKHGDLILLGGAFGAVALGVDKIYKAFKLLNGVASFKTLIGFLGNPIIATVIGTGIALIAITADAYGKSDEYLLGSEGETSTFRVYHDLPKIYEWDNKVGDWFEEHLGFRFADTHTTENLTEKSNSLAQSKNWFKSTWKEAKIKEEEWRTWIDENEKLAKDGIKQAFLETVDIAKDNVVTFGENIVWFLNKVSGWIDSILSFIPGYTPLAERNKGTSWADRPNPHNLNQEGNLIAPPAISEYKSPFSLDKMKVNFGDPIVESSQKGALKVIGGEIVGALADGILSGTANVTTETESVSNQAMGTFEVLPKGSNKIGADTTGELALGLLVNQDIVKGNSTTIADESIKGLNKEGTLSEESKGIGVDYIQSFIDGIKSLPLVGPALGLVQTVIDTFKSGFKEQSPSKVMFDIGQNVIFGLLNGMSVRDLVGFSNTLVGHLIDSFQGGSITIKSILSVLGDEVMKKMASIGITFGTSVDKLGNPLNNMNVTSPFGWRTDPITGERTFHSGTDFGGNIGDEVYATGAGKVIQAGTNGGYGISVTLDHGGGLHTLYAHLSALRTLFGEHVDIGQVIGLLGSTGRSTGPHLHYEVRQDGQAIPPSFAKGTDNFIGGLAHVNERGGEILNLPSGSQVIPHDKTVEISKAQGRAEAYEKIIKQSSSNAPPQEIDNSTVFNERSIVIEMTGTSTRDLEEVAEELMHIIARKKEKKNMSVRTPIFRTS